MVNELTDTSDSFVLLCPKCSQLAQISCEAAPGCSAGFQTCCIADFQIGGACDGARLAGLETHDTADLEVCATSVAAWPRSVLFRGYNFTGFPVSADLSAAKMTS